MCGILQLSAAADLRDRETLLLTYWHQEAHCRNIARGLIKGSIGSMKWTVKNFQKSRRKTDSVFTVGFVIILLLFGLSPYQNWIVRSSNKRSEDKEIKQNKDWKKSRRNKEGRKSAQSKEGKIQKRKRFTKIKNKKTDSEMKVRGFKATDPDNSRAPADKESQEKKLCHHDAK